MSSTKLNWLSSRVTVAISVLALLALVATAAPTPALAQPTPADTLVGKAAITCSYGVPIEARVARAEWTKTVVGDTAPGNGMWVVAVVDIMNRGQAQESLYSFFKLKDERGREFKWAQYPPDPINLAAAYGVKGSYENFTPGVTEQSIMTFVVAGDAKTLTLEQNALDPAACASVAPSSAAPDSSGPSSAAPAPPQAPANPADTLLGKKATVCSYGVPIEVQVARTEWTKSVLNNGAPGNGMWVVAIVDVTNQGLKAESLYSFYKLKDERGRDFKWAQYPPDPIDLAAAYGVKGSYENFAPGITEQSVLTFVVAGDVQSLTIEPNPLDPAPCM
jgi:hypothetical protein